MKLKNVLIVVKDIERARQFYHDLFGLEMILDNDGNMVLTEGLVLQEERYAFIDILFQQSKWHDHGNHFLISSPI